jgi:hypothetical protein
MPKRFTATEIWEEDWFLEVPNDYKLFWYYMLSNCDHAGLFKVNLRSFSSLLEVKVSSSSALSYYNIGKERVRVINESLWLIEDFFSFQYGHSFNINNPMHRGIKLLYDRNGIELTSIRGLKEVKLTLKEKDKDTVLDNQSSVRNTEGQDKKNGKEPMLDFEAQKSRSLSERIRLKEIEAAAARAANNNGTSD